MGGECKKEWLKASLGDLEPSYSTEHRQHQRQQSLKLGTVRRAKFVKTLGDIFATSTVYAVQRASVLAQKIAG